MKTPEQLKGSIRSMASKKNLRAQEVLQMYLLWDNYVTENKYIGELTFQEVLDTVDGVARLLDF